VIKVKVAAITDNPHSEIRNPVGPEARPSWLHQSKDHVMTPKLNRVRFSRWDCSPVIGRSVVAVKKVLMVCELPTAFSRNAVQGSLGGT
jgi:hypothetical protein